MSFDIWFQRFKNGEPDPFPRAVVDELFGPYTVHASGTFFRVRFPDGSGADIAGAHRSPLSSLTFNHCGGKQFANAFYELLKRTGSVIYWPEGGCVVADSSIIPQLPDFLTSQFGTPALVQSGREIFDCIVRS